MHPLCTPILLLHTPTHPLSTPPMHPSIHTHALPKQSPFIPYSTPHTAMQPLKHPLRTLPCTPYTFTPHATSVYPFSPPIHPTNPMHTPNIPSYTSYSPPTSPLCTPIPPLRSPIYTPCTPFAPICPPMHPLCTPYSSPVHPLYTPPMHPLYTPYVPLYTPIHPHAPPPGRRAAHSPRAAPTPPLCSSVSMVAALGSPAASSRLLPLWRVALPPPLSPQRGAPEPRSAASRPAGPRLLPSPPLPAPQGRGSGRRSPPARSREGDGRVRFLSPRSPSPKREADGGRPLLAASSRSSSCSGGRVLLPGGGIDVETPRSTMQPPPRKVRARLGGGLWG